MAEQEDVTWDTPQEDVTWDNAAASAPSIASQIGEQAVKGAKGLVRGAASFAGGIGQAVMGPFGPEQHAARLMHDIGLGPEPQTSPEYGTQLAHKFGVEDKQPGFAGTIGEFVGNPASYFGPGGWASKLVGAGLSGAGSEAAGELAQGTGWEGPARVAGSFAGPAAARVVAPQLAPEQAMLARRGVTQMTPGQLAGGIGKWGEDALSSVPILGSFINSGRRRSIESFNKSVANQALEPIGERLAPSTQAGHDAVAEVEQKLGDRYDALLPRLTYIPDAQFGADLARIRQRAETLPQSNIDQFERILDSRLGPPAPMHGQLYKEIESELNHTASGYMSSSDHAQREMGQRLGDVVSSMKGVLERSNPAQEAAQLRALNQGWAMFTRMRDAATNRTNSAGVFTPSDLLSAVKRGDKSVRKGSFARGDALMQQFGEAGQKVLPSSIPTSGTSERAMMAGLAGAAADAFTGGHAGGFLAAHPALIAAGAAGTLPYTRAGTYLANRYANPGAARAAFGVTGRGWPAYLRPFTQTNPFEQK